MSHSSLGRSERVLRKSVFQKSSTWVCGLWLGQSQPTDSAHQKNFDPIFASNSKTAHFERKRWAPPFKPCPRGVHWWWSRPNWLSWRRETWLGPSKKCHLGPLWMEGKNCPHNSEKLMGTARGDRGSDISFSAPELKMKLSSGEWFLGFWVIA